MTAAERDAVRTLAHAVRALADTVIALLDAPAATDAVASVPPPGLTLGEGGLLEPMRPTFGGRAMHDPDVPSSDPRRPGTAGDVASPAAVPPGVPDTTT